MLGGNVYGGDINNVSSVTGIFGAESMRQGIDETVQIIEDGQKSISEAYDNGMREINEKFGNAAEDKTGEEWLKAEAEREANARAVLAREKKRAEEWKKAQAEAAEDIYSSNTGENTGVIKSKESEKAAKEQEAALKKSIQDKFRELETEQYEKEYDDSWLLEQKRAFLETFDHNTDLYKDYNLSLLKEQKSTADKLTKETENTAKKQQDAIEKSYNSIIKSRDSLASSLSQKGDIFQTSEETDKLTGAKKKSRSIDIEGFEKKIEAKKKLTSKIAELLEKNTPDDIITELLKQDPEDALAYANELLRSPDKLDRLSKGFENDNNYSKAIANMITENSEDFKSLGEESGAFFGEGFISAFKENWEDAFGSVFGDEEFMAQSSAAVKSANSSAASESTYIRREYVVSESSSGGKSSKSFGASSQGVYRIVDINGRYIASVVNAENSRTAISGGG